MRGQQPAWPCPGDDTARRARHERYVVRSVVRWRHPGDQASGQGGGGQAHGADGTHPAARASAGAVQDRCGARCGRDVRGGTPADRHSAASTPEDRGWRGVTRIVTQDEDSQLLAMVSAVQLGFFLGGMALVIRCRQAFDIPFWHGQESAAGRDWMLMGTALSAPVAGIVPMSVAGGRRTARAASGRRWSVR